GPPLEAAGLPKGGRMIRRKFMVVVAGAFVMLAAASGASAGVRRSIGSAMHTASSAVGLSHTSTGSDVSFSGQRAAADFSSPSEEPSPSPTDDSVDESSDQGDQNDQGENENDCARGENQDDQGENQDDQ